MGGEDGLLWTVECLRGRLLAERATSKIAEQEAQELGNKVIELEKMLRIEMKAMKKSEKRLKFVMKKLEFLNISYVSEYESESSSLFEKSEICSVSSTSSSSTKQPNGQNTTNKKECSVILEDLNNIEQITTYSPSHSGTAKSIAEKTVDLEARQNCHGSNTDDTRSKSSVEDEEINRENDQDSDDHVDNSLAIVPVIDPTISNKSVKDVLDSLRYAREKLQSSMDGRHVIRV